MAPNFWWKWAHMGKLHTKKLQVGPPAFLVVVVHPSKKDAKFANLFQEFYTIDVDEISLAGRGDAYLQL